MRWSLPAAAVLCLLASGAYAFDRDEHKNISNTALAAARDVVRPASTLNGRIDHWLTASPSFGDVTVAVDWFQSPGDFLTPDERVLKQKLDGREHNYFWRGLAAHHNLDHFQQYALECWRGYHREAIELIRADPDHPDNALLREAVALHYLEDFFSVGHLVTPRANMHDAVAGHLHDHYNFIGVDFRIDTSGSNNVDAILAVLPQPNRWITSDDIEAFKRAQQKGLAHFHGDSTLDDNREQKVFVTVVAALSVAEVLAAAGPAPRPGLETCFASRSAVPKTSPRDPKQVSIIPDEIHGPDGAIRIATGEGGVASDAVDCSGPAWLGRFETLHEKTLTKDMYDLSGFTFRGEVARARHGRGLRRNVDLIYFFMADDPPGQLKNRNTREDFDTGGIWMRLRMGGFGPSYSQGDGYHSWALLYDFYQATRWRSLAWGFRLAPRRYTYGGTHHWKPDLGLKAVIGLDVVSVNLAVERARHIDTLGRFRPTYFVTAGVESSTPVSWLTKSLAMLRQGKKKTGS